jgi:hypothetical protein
LILNEIRKKSVRDFTNLLDPSGTRQAGLVLVYRKYAPLDTELESLEQQARDAKRGLWADPAPIPPWVYRKVRRA